MLIPAKQSDRLPPAQVAQQVAAHRSRRSSGIRIREAPISIS